MPASLGPHDGSAVPTGLYSARVKTAVSVPDDVFDQAEQLARRQRVSRSELYTTALRALLADDAAVTERLDAVYGTDEPDPGVQFVAEAARRAFSTSDW